MYTFLLIVLIFVALLLVAAVLMQAGKGGGLAANFGGAASTADSFVGTRQAANLLTRSSWWLGAVFLLLGYMLSLMSGRTATPESVLDEPFQQAAPVAPAPTTPAVPLEPVPTQPAPATPPTTSPQP